MACTLAMDVYTYIAPLLVTFKDIEAIHKDRLLAVVLHSISSLQDFTPYYGKRMELRKLPR